MGNKNPIDGNGNILHDGDRVYCLDYGVEKVVEKCYGTLYHHELDGWWVNYDDGDESLVTDFSKLWKA